MIKPIYEKMASDVPEVAFAKIDVDDNAGAASKYEVCYFKGCLFYKHK